MTRSHLVLGILIGIVGVVYSQDELISGMDIMKNVPKTHISYSLIQQPKAPILQDNDDSTSEIQLQMNSNRLFFSLP